MLDIRDLKVHFGIRKGHVRAVDGVSFGLERGETMGLVGESGCGKTTTAFSIMHLLPPNGHIVGGEILFEGDVIGHAALSTELDAALRGDAWYAESRRAVQRARERLTELEIFGATDPQLAEELKNDEKLLDDVEKVLPSGDKKSTEGQLRAAVDAAQEGWGTSRRQRRLDASIEERMRKVRWKQVSMIFQSAMNAFNPVYRVGDQIVEAFLAHEDMTREEALVETRKLFELVGLDPRRIDGYPHEFSGGMRQRAMIAMALALRPKLIIADEPTTALDVIMQDRILAEIRDLQRKLHTALMIITHDISVVAEVGEKIGVMYAGQMAEWGPISDVFERPCHPYTIGLLAAFPSIKGGKKRLQAIPGSPPDLADPPSGCRFHPRCRFAQEVCKTKVPEAVQVDPGHFAACHFARDIHSGALR